MSKISEEQVSKWLSMSRSGLFQEAKDYYYNELFPAVIDNFVANTKETGLKTDILFSVLGFSPEPIILTQRALKPAKHIIFYNNPGEKFENEIYPYLKKFLTSDFELRELPDETFRSIYGTLREELILHPAQNYALDITGGKKSMVASAAIFGRDFNFNVIYVDYTEYNPELRRPTPGTEILNLVYNPCTDLPEIIFPSSI